MLPKPRDDASREAVACTKSWPGLEALGRAPPCNHADLHNLAGTMRALCAEQLQGTVGASAGTRNAAGVVVSPPVQPGKCRCLLLRPRQLLGAVWVDRSPHRDRLQTQVQRFLQRALQLQHAHQARSSRRVVGSPVRLQPRRMIRSITATAISPPSTRVMIDAQAAPWAPYIGMSSRLPAACSATFRIASFASTSGRFRL